MSPAPFGPPPCGPRGRAPIPIIIGATREEGRIGGPAFLGYDHADYRAWLRRLVDEGAAVIFRITRWVIQLTPIGVFGLIGSVVGGYGWEALLPLLADDRVASGSAALMSGELELRLAAIDARLRDPALDARAREELWRSRVDTLLALVQFEGERSWLAAQGSRFDTALVQID